jgi:hypothetical protein
MNGKSISPRTMKTDTEAMQASYGYDRFAFWILLPGSIWKELHDERVWEKRSTLVLHQVIVDSTHHSNSDLLCNEWQEYQPKNNENRHSGMVFWGMPNRWWAVAPTS